MAQLNLRDRVIETTIAYVGSAEGSGASSFARVKEDAQRGRAGALRETTVEGGRLLSLDWRPREGQKLNDCDVTVKLVSTSGPIEAEAMQSVLVDADGLVLVLEADPDATQGNERAVAIIREALARAPAKKMPVVVQVNQREGSLGKLDVEGLDLENWPQVTAYAAKGDGVMETLQRAVDDVVESMQRPSPPEPAAPRPPGIRAEGNPLLGALRRVLQATVSEQMSASEARLVAHIEERMNAREEVTRALSEKLGSIDSWMGRVETALRTVAERTTAGREHAASRDDLARVLEQISTEGSVHRDAIAERLSSLHGGMDRIEATVIEAGARATATGALAATRTDVERMQKSVMADAGTHREAILADLKEQRKGVREDSARAIAAGTQPMLRMLEALSAETTKWSAQNTAANVASALERFGVDKEDAFKRLAEANEDGLRSVDSLAAESRVVAAHVGDLGTQIQHVDASLGRRFSEVRDSLRAFVETTDKRTEALQSELAALTDELRKKNKGWFS